MSKDEAKTRRCVRSFVRREGRLTARQKRAMGTLWDRYVLPMQEGLALDTIFNEGLVTLEIGFGMGASLAVMAKEQPEMNFLGVEVHRAGVASLIADLDEQGSDNVRVICTDALEVLKNVIPDKSLARILIFFPDPWHKKRHHKRRLIQVSFIESIKKKLKPGAILHLATDWEPYAEHMREVILQVAGLKEGTIDDDPRPMTKFERRGVRLGHEITDLIYVAD